jgi:hypothetical protein
MTNHLTNHRKFRRYLRLIKAILGLVLLALDVLKRLMDL